ncbi:hypothetical protein EUX98_g6982 [Antrodiella citrinella]|uniref:Uncharacterized protein n=1 Tax=Antrodiella citrinella TaxID=2447956 RepID=A0A4S4MPF4_9APHY|nr:hypothetical protein EUX98_g6982 [Antrodiella citrinella]
MQHDPPCSWTYDFTKHIEDDVVDSEDLSDQCSAVYSWADHMRFWDHGKLYMCGSTIRVPKSDKLPPESIVDCVQTIIGPTNMHYLYSTNDCEEIAQKYLSIVWKEMTQHDVSLEIIQKHRKYFAYLAHKEWHDEK